MSGWPRRLLGLGLIVGSPMLGWHAFGMLVRSGTLKSLTSGPTADSLGPDALLLLALVGFVTGAVMVRHDRALRLALAVVVAANAVRIVLYRALGPLG